MACIFVFCTTCTIPRGASEHSQCDVVSSTGLVKRWDGPAAAAGERDQYHGGGPRAKEGDPVGKPHMSQRTLSAGPPAGLYALRWMSVSTPTYPKVSDAGLAHLAQLPATLQHLELNLQSTKVHCMTVSKTDFFLVGGWGVYGFDSFASPELRDSGRVV